MKGWFARGKDQEALSSEDVFHICEELTREEDITNKRKKYFRIFYESGDPVPVNDGWCESKSVAQAWAKSLGLSEEHIHEYEFTKEEANREKVYIQTEDLYFSNTRDEGIYVGPRGGRYRINKNGRKSYDVT